MGRGMDEGGAWGRMEGRDGWGADVVVGVVVVGVVVGRRVSRCWDVVGVEGGCAPGGMRANFCFGGVAMERSAVLSIVWGETAELG